MAGHGTGTFETLVHLDELHGRDAVPDDFGRGTIPADPMASPDYLLVHSGRFCPAHLRARHPLLPNFPPHRQRPFRRLRVRHVLLDNQLHVASLAVTAYHFLWQLRETHGNVALLLVSIVDTFGKFQMFTWFTFLYVAYHNVAHRIGVSPPDDDDDSSDD